jgi:hypothetical protein
VPAPRAGAGACEHPCADQVQLAKPGTVAGLGPAVCGVALESSGLSLTIAPMLTLRSMGSGCFHRLLGRGSYTKV